MIERVVGERLAGGEIVVRSVGQPLPRQPRDGVLRTWNTYDAGTGHVTETKSKITVQATSASTKLQWRRVLHFRTTGQLDSVHTQRTDSCDDPCNTPWWSHTLEAQYDSRGRVSRRLLGGTVGTFNYAYGGPNDELTAITADAGYADPVGGSNVNFAWSYGSSGTLSSETVQGSRTTSYQHDTFYRVTSLTDAVGTSYLAYHATRGTADSLKTPWNDWVTYQLDGVGRITGPWLDGPGTDLSRTQVWRTHGALGEIVNNQGYEVGKHLLQDGFPDAAYDSLSPRWTERHGSGGSLQTLVDSLRYDGWERVRWAHYLTNGAVTATDLFEYDQQGNLSINNDTWTFDVDRNRVTSAWPCTSFSYDDAGNVTQKTCSGVTWTYTYDALDRLTNVSNTAGLSAAYTYDAVGQRIAKSVNATVTRFVWRRGHVIYEATGAFGLLRSYTWGFATDDLVAIHDHSSGADYYVVQDKLRTVRGLVNRTGTWQAAWRYKAYGQQLSSAGSLGFTLRFRWAGAQYDEETGFYFLRSRYYDPSLGRFVQEDKIGYAGGLNLYAYSGRPTEVRDPSGTSENYDQQYVPPPPELPVSTTDNWGWVDGDWDLLTGIEQAWLYVKYEEAYNKLYGEGAFKASLESWGKGHLDRHTRALTVEEFGRVYSGFLEVQKLGKTEDLDWAFTVNMLTYLANTGRMAVNNAFVGAGSMFSMHTKANILWVHGNNIFGTGYKELGHVLAHEMGQVYYKHPFSTLSYECQAQAFADSVTGWGYHPYACN